MTSRLLDYAKLVRLPNVFTALADIGLGALLTGALPGAWPVVALLLPASACLYLAGMVWNDYFDLEQDKRERPFRPLPSGRVPLGIAAALGSILLAAGVGFALLAAIVQGAGPMAWRATPVVLALLLVAAILLYDAWLKRTWAGPLSMASCRFLNVLLGISAAGTGLPGLAFYVASIVGLYIVGVTWFARTEARDSNATMLAAAAGVMFAALLLAVPLPALLADGPWPHETAPAYVYLLVAFGFYVGVPMWRAVGEPTPPRVQAAVKRLVLGLMVLDAILATAGAGWTGLTLLLLLPPALYLGRWLYST